MASVFTAPLPVTEFPAFREFVLRTAPQGLPCGDERLWTFADAASAAVSVKHALGHPGIFAELAADQAERALAEMLVEFNTPNWRMDSEVLVRMPVRGDAVTFALDEEGRGYDEAAWAPDRDLVRRLNKWCERALDAFFATQRRGGPAEDEASPARANPAERERIDPPTTGESASRSEGEPDEAARSQANLNPTTALTPASLVADYLATTSEPSKRGLKRHRQKLGLSSDHAYTWKILMRHVPVGTFKSIGGRNHKG